MRVLQPQQMAHLMQQRHTQVEPFNLLIVAHAFRECSGIDVYAITFEAKAAFRSTCLSVVY